MAKSTPRACPRIDGGKSASDRETIDPERYKHQQSTPTTLVQAGTFMAGVEGQILSLTLSLGRSKLRTVGMCFAVLGVINASFTALYSAVTHVLLKSSWKSGSKKQFHAWVAERAERIILWRGALRALASGSAAPEGSESAVSVRNWESAVSDRPWRRHGCLRLVGTCAGFIALILYFFASSSIGVSIFVVMVIFAMGVWPMVWGFCSWHHYLMKKRTSVPGHSPSCDAESK
ncbi:hypothetical protein B0H19DRAFT_1381703 [Mycena capillaripes]|nr:hypothetical protein B0H19DRAFT_1381703 [Mycena capillaripes]